MRVIRQYGMQGKGMQMADMGYVIIDAAGRIRTRQIDRRSGEHARDIVAIVQHLRSA